MMRCREFAHLDGERVYRFVRVERLAHWVNAASFLALAASGALLLLRRQLALEDGRVQQLHQLHLCVGALYFFGPALIYLIGDWRAGGRWTLAAFGWTFSEFLWLLGPMRAFILPWTKPPIVGRFNAGQRMNLLCQFSSKWALAITGCFMHFHSGQLLMYTFHVVVFGLALPMFCVHFFMALINPATRHSRHAMLGGFVDREWAAHHYPGWVERLPQAAGGAAPADSPPEEES